MINNFDVLKEQLKELAVVINSFKCEAVQLRLIELVFGEANAGLGDDDQIGTSVSPKTARRKSKKKAEPSQRKQSATKTSNAKRPGGKATLDRLLADGFFKKPKTIKQIVEHCEHNLAFKYNQSAFSGPLGRLTRDGKLKRTKNADKQYEYSSV